ncbi:hypothetical protein BJF83_17960 [Nocardiopsis sp. CNR-923]|uniref:hypothetical protein n=1 Tax=Nocardiopsis sp. CNR-923 TaxID=1904965 RepID=UPI0009624C5F|nr:hypothetical protein [Nocardiopsis sp. CNR-923]OLT27639.1 hypothetical protein BJF83_17960 [Nocardiopsis sp. CNR-923]
MRRIATILGTLTATAAISLATAVPATAYDSERETSHPRPARGKIEVELKRDRDEMRKSEVEIEYKKPVGCILLPEKAKKVENETNRRVLVSSKPCAYRPHIIDVVRPGEEEKLSRHAKSLIVW